MIRNQQWAIRCCLCLGLLAPVRAEQGILEVHVHDVHGQALGGVQLRAGAGSSLSAPTEPSGRSVRRSASATDHKNQGTTESSGIARIRVGEQMQPGDPVELEIITPAGLRWISPWDGRVFLPSNDNKSSHFVTVVLAKEGDRTALESPDALKAFAQQILKATAPKSIGDKSSEGAA